ncbi:MAG: tetratricopeptide repeat protein [Candidatus Falkowbacteria bacterium]
MKSFLSKYALWLVLLATALVYLPSLRFDFLHGDEYFHLLNNADLLTGNLQGMLTKEYIGMYQPLTSLYYWVLYNAYGLNPLAYHAANLLLHLLNIALVFWLVFRVSGRRLTAFVTAALFALQPANTESIVWVSAASNLLSSAFLLGSLLMYWQAKNRRQIFLSFFLAIVAMLCKPSAIILPLLMLLFDYLKNKKITARDIWSKLSLWLMAIAMGLATIYARQHDGHFVGTIAAYSLIEQLAVYLFSYFYYFYNAILPLGLAPSYLYPAKLNGQLPWFYYAGALASLTGVIIIIVKKYYKTYWPLIAWFLLNLVLVVRLKPIGKQVIANRYTYLAGLAVYFLLSLLFVHFYKQIKWRRAAITALIGYLLLLGAISLFYSRNWQDDYSLATASLVENVNNPEAGYIYDNRGSVLLKQGLVKEAMADFSRAIALNPQLSESYNNIGIITADYQHDPGHSIVYFDSAIRLQPGRTDYLYNRGSALAANRQWALALADFDQAINNLPSVPPEYRHNRGNVRLSMGDFQGAVDDFSQVLRVHPNALTYLQRGQAYWEQHLKAAACADWTEASQLNLQAATAKLAQYCH